MKKSIIIMFLVSGAAVAVFTARGSKSSASTGPGPIERGEYLVRYGGCSDCHTPKRLGVHGPEDDLSRYLSGHPAEVQLPPPDLKPSSVWNAGTAGMTAWAGPWGISYAANLTPDESTGLGIWTEEMFIKAMRTGKHFGESRDILPPMPWQCVGALNDDDLKAIFAFLKSIPPVRNPVPTPVPPDGPWEFE